MNRKLIPIVGILTLFCASAWAFQDGDELRQEEMEDYYKKWLEQDVRYIISDEERAVFNELTTDDEKEQFVEQFWFRRDLDPGTAFNEFKEEHYRRIAYANEHYTSGDPGWLTDRGRVYIIHGPPDNLVSRPTGGTYVRTPEEGGSVTSVFPYEKWTYRYIEGVGQNVELEFVDSSDSGKYELAVYNWEKEGVLRFSPSSGANYFEEIGMSTRAQRPGMMPAAGGAGYGVQSQYSRLSDTPFARYERVAKVGAAPVVKYNDLRELVNVNIRYETLPFRVKADYFKLNDAQVLVPITVELNNKDLSFEPENGTRTARVAVFGIVSSMTNRIITEFEDDIEVRYGEQQLQDGLAKSSVYQKIVPLEARGRYKLDLILKDLNSLHTGVIRKAIVPPSYEVELLQGSSLILSDQIETLDDIPEKNEMFVIGDVKVLPRMDQTFTNEMPLGIYYQIYNAALDQSSWEPSLRVTYSLLKDGELLAVAADEAGESTQFFSGRRVVLMKRLSLDGLNPGKYQIEVKVEDLVSDQHVSQVGEFKIAEREG